MDEIEILIASKLESIRHRGERILPNGARLISPAPEIAPDAWHYVLFPPLEISAIKQMERELSIEFPLALKVFYQTWNGLSFFGNRLNLWGQRKSYVREGDDSWQPFDLVTTNLRFGRPEGSPETVLFLGSIDRGEKWIFLDLGENGGEKVGSTIRTSFEPDEYWPDFLTWLESTFNKLWSEFEENVLFLKDSH